MYTPYDPNTADTTDKIAWALCQIIDDDAPLRWARYRAFVKCIALNNDLMAGLTTLRDSEARRYTAVPVRAVTRANQLYELAKRYHEQTEAYDRTVCTGPIVGGSIQPYGGAQTVLVNRNAQECFQQIAREGEALGFDRAELRRAISAFM